MRRFKKRVRKGDRNSFEKLLRLSFQSNCIFSSAVAEFAVDSFCASSCFHLAYSTNSSKSVGHAPSVSYSSKLPIWFTKSKVTFHVSSGIVLRFLPSKKHANIETTIAKRQIKMHFHVSCRLNRENYHHIHKNC